MPRHRFARKSRDVAATLALITTAACSAVSSDAPSEVTGTTSDKLLLDLGATLWTNNANVVPVCWMRTGYNGEKALVRNAVVATWGAVANLQFTGWGDCPTTGSARFIKIDIADKPKEPDGTYSNGGGDGQAVGYGMGILRSPGEGASVGFWLAPDHSANRGRVEYLGVHEFGHVLGFKHEQDSPDNYVNGRPVHCANQTGAVATNVRQVGPYDANSIMNYCNDTGNGQGILSPGDIVAVQSIYGLPPTASIKSVCRSAPTATSRKVKSDLAAPWPNGNKTSVGVYPSTGGAFTGWYDGLTGGGWDGRSKYAAGDFNGDGFTDIATAWNDFGWSSIAVRQSTGTGFTLKSWRDRPASFLDAAQWLPGDFNHDGFDDLAIAWNDHGSTSVGVFLSTGTSFSSYQGWASRMGGWDDSDRWVVGDFNHDGYADLATVWNNGGQNAIAVRRSTGFSFELQQSVTTADPWRNSTKWLAGDFNGDGDTDLAAAFNSNGAAQVDVHLSTGTGFSARTPWDTSGGGWSDEHDWTTGDFDGDGDWDLATVWNNGNNVVTVRKSNRSAFVERTNWENLGGWMRSTQWCAGRFTN
ncbi:FG-GAP-like repeat-containing protein [Pendulispora rubella]|uniref:FG-GAP-like repeat-containing protein n=1 Tax=Pendulispora rubella TaxID=2741070 RepID=A0ABZ2LE69_9BACT